MDTNRKKGLLWVGIVLVVVIVAGAAYWYHRLAETVTQLAPGQTLVSAPQGNVVSNFPTELILDQGVAVQHSYRIQYADSNASQPYVEYLSSKSLADEIAAYHAYFAANGWTVTHEATTTETPQTFFYAFKDKAQASVILAPQTATTTDITISYTATP